MADTTIEWTDATWNPVAGCQIITPGCTNCYPPRRLQERQHGDREDRWLGGQLPEFGLGQSAHHSAPAVIAGSS